MNIIIDTKVLWLLSFVALFFFGLYIYFINQTVHYVVLRKDIESTIAGHNSNLSGLEASYMALQNNITHTYAKERGFVEVKQVHFASRQGVPTTISLK